MKRFIPQWLAVAYCTVRGHPQERHTAWHDGVQVIVRTCMCGRKQSARVIAANRHLRRARKKKRR